MGKFVKGQPRPPGAGRKKGTPNRATVEKQRRQEEQEKVVSTEMPLDYLLRQMRSNEASPADRLAAARAAAPYCHAQLQAVAHQYLQPDRTADQCTHHAGACRGAQADARRAWGW
jgi:hypothetical protein